MHDIEYYNSIFISFSIQFYDMQAAFIISPQPLQYWPLKLSACRERNWGGNKKLENIAIVQVISGKVKWYFFFKNRLYIKYLSSGCGYFCWEKSICKLSRFFSFPSAPDTFCLTLLKNCSMQFSGSTILRNFRLGNHICPSIN